MPLSAALLTSCKLTFLLLVPEATDEEHSAAAARAATAAMTVGIANSSSGSKVPFSVVVFLKAKDKGIALLKDF